MSYKVDGSLQCDMRSECAGEPAYLDDHGYVYCPGHGVQRQTYTRCRKLRPAELNKLRRGEPIARY